MRRLYISNVLFCLLIMHQADLSAQTLASVAKQIRSAKNISYLDKLWMKISFEEGASTDYIISMLAPDQSPAGGRYKLKGERNWYAYDGSKLLTLSLADSTYRISQESVSGQNTRTLLYWAKELAKFSRLSEGKVVRLRDTLIDKLAYASILVSAKDTIIDKERCYTFHRLVIDKKTQLPFQIISWQRGLMDGTVVTFNEIHSYSNYKVNAAGFPDLSAAIIPDHFKLPLRREPAVFLPAGTAAPAINAVDMAGSPLAMERYKGKMVLLNFSLIGCPHCVAAAKMLNNLSAQYKNDLVILNIYPFDKSESIANFDQQFVVKNKSFISDPQVQKLYPFDGYPCFYLLDRSGVVAASYKGFYQELEAEVKNRLVAFK